MTNDFKMCPMCGGNKIENHGNRKWICPDCGFDLYNNVAAAVGIVLYDENNNVLFEKRAKEPRKGCACLPGGFVDFNETAEEAMIRECREELGIEITDFSYLCTFPNVYPYKNIEYRTCDIFFSAKIPSAYKSMEDLISHITAEQSEVQGIVTYKVQTDDDIANIPLAFESAVNTLKKFIKR